MTEKTIQEKFEFSPSLPPSGVLGLVDLEPNKAYHGATDLYRTVEFSLAIVEFDDQGQCHDRKQMDLVAHELQCFEDADQEPIIVAYTHGWKHNARTDDSDLSRFCDLLNDIALLAMQAEPRRPVLGVFMGWRGRSLRGPFPLTDLTFWNRKKAGLRVAMGAPRELLGRLRLFRTARLEKKRKTAFIIVGHSFGGLVVFSALAQTLIQSAISFGPRSEPPFADLILLVNPAFEAVRYLPVHDLVKLRFSNGLPSNPAVPVWFVSVTTTNDRATGFWFPAGMWIYQYLERAKSRPQRAAIRRTMGHLKSLITHRLTLAPPSGAQSNRRDAVLSPVQFNDQNPFLVVSTNRDIIDGHNGIWGNVFQKWVIGLLGPHL